MGFSPGGLLSGPLYLTALPLDTRRKEQVWRRLVGLTPTPDGEIFTQGVNVSLHWGRWREKIWIHS